jgi:gp16 family phage-associated protein
VSKNEKKRIKRPIFSEAELEAAKMRLFKQGIRVKDFAKMHGFSQNAVSSVLCGFSKASSGKGHEIAKALGLK